MTQVKTSKMNLSLKDNLQSIFPLMKSFRPGIFSSSGNVINQDGHDVFVSTSSFLAVGIMSNVTTSHLVEFDFSLTTKTVRILLTIRIELINITEMIMRTSKTICLKI